MSIWKMTNKVLCHPSQFPQKKCKHLYILLLINDLLKHMSTVDSWTREILATLMLPFSFPALWSSYGQISLSVTTLYLHLHLLLIELYHRLNLPNPLWICLNFCGFYKDLLLSQGSLTSLFFNSKMQLRFYLVFLKNSVLNLYMYNICWGLS